MKLENLKKAAELQSRLTAVESKIYTLEKAANGKDANCMVHVGNRYVNTNEMKHGSDIFASIQMLFLHALDKERRELLDEIEALD